MSVPPRSLKELFLTVLEVAPEDRAAWLERECAADASLREHLREMLAAHDAPQSLLDQPVAPLAASSPRNGVSATVDEPPVRDQPGAVIGPYRLLQEIGEGGMGTVYMAEQTAPVKRVVALKVIKAGMDTRQVLARFGAERQALALMDHPNIAKVHDAGATEEGRPYFVMELVKGVPITRYCDEQRLTPRERLELFIPVCQAVQHAHQKGIIHRDLKPSNVVVGLCDGQPIPKIIDFGVAKAAGPKLTEATLFTGFGTVIGTPEYMSPEQAQLENPDIDTRSDIYSLGVLLYELLTGTTPFTKKDLEKAGLLEMLRVIREQEPPKPSAKLSTAEGLPTLAASRGTEPARLTKLMCGELDWIVMKALEKDRNRRYETANGLARDIGRYLQDEPVTAGPPSATYRLRKFARRNRALLATATVVALSLVAVAVLAVLYADRQHRFGLEQAEATRKQAAATRKIAALAGDLKTSLAESNRHLAMRNFDRGQAAFEKGEIGEGMLWMIECWRSAVDAGDAAWQRLGRANLAHWRPQYPQLKAVLSHTSSVYGAAFSPDSRTVIVGSMNGTAQLWDVASGRKFGPPLQLGSRFPSFSFSSDGKTVLTCAQGNSAQLWDATTGAPLGVPMRLPPQVFLEVAVIQPEGKIVLVGSEGTPSSPNSVLRIWDPATGQPIGPPLTHSEHVYPPVFSPDGRVILTPSDDGTAQFWDVASGEPYGPPLKRSGGFWCAAFSPDGKTILTGIRDGTAQLWDAVTRQPIGPPMPHDSEVRFVAFSPNGKTILTGCMAKEARLWDTATGQPIGVLAHQGQVSATAFSPDGSTILTGSLDGTVRLWDANPGQPVGKGLEIPSTDYIAGLSPDGKVLISGPREPNSGRYLQLWNTTTRKLVARIPQPGGNAKTEFSSDGKVLLTTEADQTARLWDATTGGPLGPRWPTIEPIARTSLSRDGKTVVFVGKDKDETIWICSTLTGSIRGRTSALSGMAYGVGLSPDGKTFFTGAEDGQVRLWDAATLTPLGNPLPHPSCVNEGGFSHDGKSLWIHCEDGGLWLWDLATRKPIMPPIRHQGPTGAAFSPDDKTMAIWSKGKSPRLWDLATSLPIGPSLRHASGLAFLADGKTLFTTGSVPLLSPVPRDLPDELERVATWVEVITGLRLDTQQRLIQVLDSAAWLARRERLKQLGGPPETGPEQRLDPILFGPDPTARARSFMERKQWDAAEAAFEEAMRARPYNIDIIEERGDLYVKRGLWSEAAAYYATTVKQYPDVAPLHEQLAVTRLLAGDLPGYQAACAAMLERFKPSDDSTAVIRVAYACSLAPKAVTDWAGLTEVSEASVRWAEAVSNLPGRNRDSSSFTRWLASNRRAGAAVLFRAGRLEEALQWFEQSHKVIQPRSWDLLFVAIIHSRLGHEGEARRLLDQADQWIAEADKASPGSETDGPRWNSLTEKPVILLLRREAESLIHANSSFPADPFAHGDAARTSSAPARTTSGGR